MEQRDEQILSDKPENPEKAENESRTHCEAKVRAFRELLAQRKQLERRLSRWRLFLFLAGVGCLFGLAAWETLAYFWYALLTGVIVAFLVAARRQERAVEERERAYRLLNWYERALARQDRDWKKLRRPEYKVPLEYEQIATDLDLFGSGSLFQLLDETQMEMSRHRLASWMLKPAAADEVKRRYRALRCLAADREFREEFYDRASALANSLADPGEFVAWSEAPPWYDRHPWLGRFVPFSSAAILVAVVLWAVTFQIAFAAIALLLLTIHAVLMLGWGGGIYAIFNRVQSRHREVAQYRELFTLLDEAADRHAALAEWLDQDESPSFRSSNEAWRHLERIMALCALRQAGLMSILHAALQPTVLWDFHVLRLLDGWKRKYRESVAAWFDELAAFEALASLSVLADDHPDWVEPDLDESADRWQGTAVGHPLLRDDMRVSNDVTAGPAGTVLLVTGSNMSGKSTLLRSIGVNTVLAQAGAPVCAMSLRLPPLVIATSMRIRDSLEAGVSFYLAELKRLKEIVDLASSREGRGGRGLLYLLDEILQGTNSKERHIAVAHVVAHLIEEQAIGAISTHDLELASSPLLSEAVQPVHFRESFRDGPEGREMVFDYRLREGVATTTNALALLEMVGLGNSTENSEEGDRR